MYKRQTLAYVLQDAQVDTWVGTWDALARRWAEPTPLTRTGYQERPSAWSSDSARVWYTSDEGGRVRAVEHAPGGAPKRRAASSFSESWVFEHGGALFGWRWAEGARDVALVRTDAESPEGRPLWSVPLISTGRGNQLPPLNVRARCASGGQRCFWSDDSGGAFTLQAFDPESGVRGDVVLQQKEPVISAHGWDVSPDGSQVALPAGPGAVTVVGLQSGERRTVVGPVECLLQYAAFAPGDSGLFVTATCDTRPAFRLLHLGVDGTSTLLYRSESAWLAHPSVSPDGTKLALAVKAHSTDIWVLAPRVEP